MLGAADKFNKVGEVTIFVMYLPTYCIGIWGWGTLYRIETTPSVELVDQVL